MLRRLLIPALAAGVLLAGASAAQARTPHDPCHGDGISQQRDGHGNPTRICYARFQAPPHRSARDPAEASGPACPNGYRIPGSNGAKLVSAMAWDYWTYNGEWVVWNFPLGELRPAYTRSGAQTDGDSGVYPTYHNWSPWGWGVRTFHDCTPETSGLVAPVAAMARTTVADPVPTVRHGDDEDNVIHDGAGSDELIGGPGDDTMTGGAGDDIELGGAGRDHLSGGPGDDELFDDHGKDILEGGPGNDRFSTKDGNHDVIDCGPGEDVAVGDPHDTFTHCEHVYTTPQNTPAHPPDVG